MQTMCKTLHKSRVDRALLAARFPPGFAEEVHRTFVLCDGA